MSKKRLKRSEVIQIVGHLSTLTDENTAEMTVQELLTDTILSIDMEEPPSVDALQRILVDMKKPFKRTTKRQTLAESMEILRSDMARMNKAMASLQQSVTVLQNQMVELCDKMRELYQQPAEEEPAEEQPAEEQTAETH